MIALDTFEKGSVVHALVVVTSLVLLALLARTSHSLRKRNPKLADRYRTWLGIGVVVFQIFHNLYWLVFREGGFDWHESLPLHICDIAGLLAGVALIWPRRWLVAIFYFWGVGLSSLAFALPVIDEGPTHLVFWTFWISHFIVVGGALFFVLAEGYRPTWRDLLVAFAFSLVYVLVVLAVNGMLGSNYAYLGPADDGPTAFVGPWPARIPKLVLMGLLLQVAAWAPFALARRIAAQRHPLP